MLADDNPRHAYMHTTGGYQKHLIPYLCSLSILFLPVSWTQTEWSRLEDIFFLGGGGGPDQNLTYPSKKNSKRWQIFALWTEM